jgi:integrase
MGRKPSRWTNLPKGMRARPRGKLVHYYLDTGERPRREIPLGNDYVLAVQKWAELTSAKKPADGVITVKYAMQQYFLNVVPGKASLTQKDNRQEKPWIEQFFEDPTPAPLDAVEPQHIRQFMRWRAAEAKKAAELRNVERVKKDRPAIPVAATAGQVRANRAKALFSHMWNYAREEGLTAMPNPCAGVHRFKETGRDAAPDNALVALVQKHADQPLQFAMRLADIVGQRPADVLKMSELDVRDNLLHVEQGKTKAKLRIQIEGDLAVLLEEIRTFKRACPVHALALLVNEKGQPLRKDGLRYRFDKARAAAGIDKDLFQFRDFRAKVATATDDEAGTKAAQAMLGHTTEAMTAGYIRHKVGKKVRPIR